MNNTSTIDGLISINANKSDMGASTLNARELHKKLKVGRDFSTWIRQRIKQAKSVEGVDYTIETVSSGKGRPLLEYAITLDTAIEFLNSMKTTPNIEVVAENLIDIKMQNLPFHEPDKYLDMEKEFVPVYDDIEVIDENDIPDLKSIFHDEFGTIETLVTDNGKILFKANDILQALDYSEGNWRTTLSRKCRSVAKCNVPHPQSPLKKIKVNFIDQYDVIRLVMGSKLPAAQKFEEWVIEDVVPSVLKNGFYATKNTVDMMLSDPDAAIALLENYKKEKEEKNRLIEERTANMPKVMAYDDFINSEGTYSFATAAKILCIPHTANSKKVIGRNTLLAWLRRDGILISSGEERNTPYQRFINQGLFELKTIRGDDVIPTVGIKCVTRITPKGIDYLYKKYRYSDMPKKVKITEICVPSEKYDIAM